MLYKNPTSKSLTFTCGDGPGRVILYTADAGGFVEGPDGYRAPFKRAGFIPVDELPKDERPSIQIGSTRSMAVPPKRPRPEFDGELADEEARPARPERPLPPVESIAALPVFDVAPPQDEPPAPLSAVAKLSATGSMTVLDPEDEGEEESEEESEEPVRPDLGDAGLIPAKPAQPAHGGGGGGGKGKGRSK